MKSEYKILHQEGSAGNENRLIRYFEGATKLWKFT